MTKLFTEEILEKDLQQYIISGEEARYIADVLRMKPGDEVILCDGSSVDHVLEISEITKRTIVTRIISSVPNNTEPPFHATLYQALVKGDKMDVIIQKCVELGVDKIVPVSCDHCVAKLDLRDAGKKLIRWQKIAMEAARQSGRGKIPEICEPMSFRDAISEGKDKADLIFLPWEGERAVPLSSVLDSFSKTVSKDKMTGGPYMDPPDIRFFIGPEGGFSQEEISRAQERDVPTVTLGKRILRTETAGMFVLSSLVYRLETN